MVKQYKKIILKSERKTDSQFITIFNITLQMLGDVTG